jgi:hypothetical protein
VEPEAVVQTFEEAQAAYDAGRLQDALEAYRGLAGEGHVSMELYYNLGNTYFRLGEVGRAALSYRRAWYFRPRDPDIQANLSFALQQTGALAPESGVIERFLESLNLNRWVGIALTAYWLAALAGAVWILHRPARPAALRGLILLAAVATVALAAVGSWWGRYTNPEVVVTESGQRALFAPLRGSKAHFAAPEGSVLRVEGEEGAWLRVRSGAESGWLPRSACSRIYPWSMNARASVSTRPHASAPPPTPPAALPPS